MQNLFLGRSEIFQTFKTPKSYPAPGVKLQLTFPKYDLVLPDCKLHVMSQISVYK